MRGATGAAEFNGDSFKISIHTPHAGSDSYAVCSWMWKRPISIHTPHAGSDVDPYHPLMGGVNIFQSTLPMRGATFSPAELCGLPKAFQSTLPMRGATTNTPTAQPLPEDFNPHSPCGERPDCRGIRQRIGRISIHTPHAGSDLWFLPVFPCLRYFNPHSPCGERRFSRNKDDAVLYISIHTPHAGSDYLCSVHPVRYSHFNPHSPCGERP